MPDCDERTLSISMSPNRTSFTEKTRVLAELHNSRTASIRVAGGGAGGDAPDAPRLQRRLDRTLERRIPLPSDSGSSCPVLSSSILANDFIAANGGNGAPDSEVD